MKKLFIIGTIILSLSMFGQISWATTAYVSDSFKITLRTGPSNENKIIAMLPSGEPVDVLESNEDWSHIRLPERREGLNEGWVLSRYLSTSVPWEKQYKSLKGNYDSLRETLPQVEQKLKEALSREKDLSIQLQDTTKTLKTVQKEYASLRKGASEYLTLRDIHDKTQSTLKQAQHDVLKLTEENKVLKYSNAIKWFLAGSLVLLFGLLIGLAVGQRQKKYRSSISL
ncbi:MAG: TIGR04211 family SH3 domain-containing protein [Deltaproteobacteria bacterium]|nr:TIGR04211 family SH3 domain-containing protein [Deltaproteobacteria bacterium]